MALARRLLLKGFRCGSLIRFGGAEGDLSNAKAVSRLKRDASRKKILAAVLLLPMATWRADSCQGSNDHKADAPRGTEATRDSQAKELNTITKSLLLVHGWTILSHFTFIFLDVFAMQRTPKITFSIITTISSIAVETQGTIFFRGNIF